MMRFLTMLFLVLSCMFFLTTCKKDNEANSAHWERVDVPISATVYFLKANGSILYAGTDIGLYKSTDNGTSWSEINNGLPQSKKISGLAFNGQNLYTSIQDTNAIFLSTNNGSNWVLSNSGIPYFTGSPGFYNIGGLYANGSSIFASTSFGGIFRSTDNAGSWHEVNSGFEWMPLGGYCSGPSMCLNGENSYTGFRFCGANGSVDLYRSVNNGTFWSHSSNGLESASGIYSIASNGTSLFATSKFGQIYRSTDNGDNWTLKNNGMSNFQEYNIYQLAFRGSTIYAGGLNGLYVSNDNGNSWGHEEYQLEFGGSSQEINSIAVSGSDVFIVANYSAIWRRSF